MVRRRAARFCSRTQLCSRSRPPPGAPLDVAGGELYSRPSPYPGLSRSCGQRGHGRPCMAPVFATRKRPGRDRVLALVPVQRLLRQTRGRLGRNHCRPRRRDTVRGQLFSTPRSPLVGLVRTIGKRHPSGRLRRPGLARELPAFWRVRRPRLLDALRPPLHTDSKDRLGVRHWWLARPVDIRPARVWRRCLQRKLGVPNLRFSELA